MISPDLRDRIADAILTATYPPEEWPDGPPGEGEMDQAREEADAALAVIERDPVLEIRPYYPTQHAYDAACRALEKHRTRADAAEADRDRARDIAVALEQENARLTTAVARAREVCSEPTPHPSHDHLCPDDILRALDGGDQ